MCDKRKVLKFKNTKIELFVSYIATIFGHPFIILIAIYVCGIYGNPPVSKILAYPSYILVSLLLTLLRYSFFYFWNYERIKHINFTRGFSFFTDIQTFQIFFVPISIYLLLEENTPSGGMIILGYILLLLILSILTFIITLIKLSKYDKFTIEGKM